MWVASGVLWAEQHVADVGILEIERPLCFTHAIPSPLPVLPSLVIHHTSSINTIPSCSAARMASRVTCSLLSSFSDSASSKRERASATYERTGTECTILSGRHMLAKKRSASEGKGRKYSKHSRGSREDEGITTFNELSTNEPKMHAVILNLTTTPCISTRYTPPYNEIMAE